MLCVRPSRIGGVSLFGGSMEFILMEIATGDLYISKPSNYGDWFVYTESKYGAGYLSREEVSLFFYYVGDL